MSSKIEFIFWDISFRFVKFTLNFTFTLFNYTTMVSSDVSSLQIVLQKLGIQNINPSYSTGCEWAKLDDTKTPLPQITNKLFKKHNRRFKCGGQFQLRSVEKS
jgi:hypothetical protein